MDKTAILALIEADPWMMAVIRAAARLDLPQWMIGAGFVRNKVWNHLHGIQREQVDTADIDLIYFDPSDTKEASEKAYDQRLCEWCAVEWACKNQARMHTVDGFASFVSAEDGLAHWVETATAVAVTMRDNRLSLIAPYGIGDLVNMVVRPTPHFVHSTNVLLKRMAQKQWLTKWPKLSVVLPAGGHRDG